MAQQSRQIKITVPGGLIDFIEEYCDLTGASISDAINFSISLSLPELRLQMDALENKKAVDDEPTA